jgi:hypothetical protein
MMAKKTNRPSISVTGRTYDRLRAAYPYESLAAVVDKMIATSLNNPKISARVAARCRQAYS